MRERTTWNRERIASQLRKVAEDPREMNQDHYKDQPAADAYLIGDGSPSQFAEDVNSGKGSWKADLGADGNTKRNELGMPEFRSDTFNSPEKSPGVSPSRQASLSTWEVQARADLATKAARYMLPRTASEQSIEDQALLLMDMPTASLQSTVTRLAQDQDDDDDDEGQDKQAQQQDDDDDDDDDTQAKQAKSLPPEFLEQQQKMKDKAKDGDKKDEKKKEARSRKAQQQDDDEDKGQDKQARSNKFAEDDDEDEGQDKQARSNKFAEDDEEGEGQDKQARSRKAQQQDDDEDEGQDKQARRKAPFGKEATALIRKAAVGLLAVPTSARQAAYQAMLPVLVKTAAQGLEQLPQVAQQQQQLSQQQLQSQVQELVQQAMQQQLSQGQKQQQQQLSQDQQDQQLSQDQQQVPQMAQGQDQQQMPQMTQGLQDDSQALVDQLFQEPDQGEQFFQDDIQMDSPSMDITDVTFGPEDAELQAIFAAEPEVQRALQANALQKVAPTTTRTASTRTVGTRPTLGVSQLGGGVSGASGASEEINRLSGMWNTAPDVSGVFRS